MTDRQQEAVRLLSRCSVHRRSERARIKAWALMLGCDPALEIAPHEDMVLMGYLHRYRHQHGRCFCRECFRAVMERMSLPTQFSLFESGWADR